MAHRPLVSDTTSRHGSAGYPQGGKRTRNENTYTDEDKARGYVTAKLIGQDRAEALLNIPQQTLSDWTRGRGISDEALNMAKHFASDIEQGLEAIIAAVLPEALGKVKTANYRDLMVGLGIGIDKLQLMKGLPTVIQETQGMTTEERAARIKAIMDRTKAE